MTFNILLTDLEGQKGTWCHVSMEAADLIRRSAPDKEPVENQPTLLSDWNSYASTAAPPSQTDRLLSSVEEGTKSVGSIAARAFSSVASGVTGAASSSMQTMPSTTQWAYFAAFFGSGVVFLLLAFTLFLPMLILSPSKFALTFSIGSGLILASLGALKGWKLMFGHMASKERLPFTAAYMGSLFGTLYAALMMHSYLFSLLFCATQIITLIYYVASYFPGGAQGAQMMFSTFGRGAFSMGGAALRGVFSSSG